MLTNPRPPLMLPQRAFPKARLTPKTQTGPHRLRPSHFTINSMPALAPEHIRVVLVSPQGEANIGSVCRAMACFRVHDLYVVRPKTRIGQTAYNWACHNGRAVLSCLRRVSTLKDACYDANLVVGFTRRRGKRRHKNSTLGEFASTILPSYSTGLTALVFGNEESGLTNDELDLCNRTVTIPTDPQYGSLNLAHAVTIALYELVARQTTPTLTPSTSKVYSEGDRKEPSRSKPFLWSPLKEHPASPALRLRMLEEIARFLSEYGYPSHDATLEEEITKLKDLTERCGLKVWEVNLILGIIRHFRNHHPA